MRASRPVRTLLAAGLWLLLAILLQATGHTPALAEDGAEYNMQVLDRGPIHEAFAEVSVNERQPETVIRRAVPDPLNEVPPDYRPDGASVQWIPGYWSWDEDLDNFIWVSGVWRDIPPGRQWVPGYWLAVAGGSQFVSGYWSDTGMPQTRYLPPPPEPPVTAPGYPAYDSNSIWVDGHWRWDGYRYVWQAGHWLQQQPDMVWIPAHYVWRPRGYIFVAGYWDYLPVRRGVLFAPHYYRQPIYRAYSYTPRAVLDVDVVFLSLFVRRDHHHYYFGDYRDARYTRRGFHPWYSQYATRYGHDPHYRSYRWYHSRDDDNWERKYRQKFDAYHHDHRNPWPPVSHREQKSWEHAREQRFDYRPADRDWNDSSRKDHRDWRNPRNRPKEFRDDRPERDNERPRKGERQTVEMTRDGKDKPPAKNIERGRRPETIAVSPQRATSDRDRPRQKDAERVSQKENTRPVKHPSANQAVWQQQMENEQPRSARPAKTNQRRPPDTRDSQPALEKGRKALPQTQHRSSEPLYANYENPRSERTGQQPDERQQQAGQQPPATTSKQKQKGVPPQGGPGQPESQFQGQPVDQNGQIRKRPQSVLKNWQGGVEMK